MVQSPRSRHDDTHDGHNNRKDGSAQSMAGQGIQDLSTSKDMESNQENIVREQHECREDVGSFALSEYIVSKVTCAESMNKDVSCT